MDLPMADTSVNSRWIGLMSDDLLWVNTEKTVYMQVIYWIINLSESLQDEKSSLVLYFVDFDLVIPLCRPPA